MGQEAWFLSQVSRSLWFCRLANHRPRQVTHHIGWQKQFVQFVSRGAVQLLEIFTSGAFVIQAKHVSTLAVADEYLGFFLASDTKTSMNRSISDVWNLTDDKTVIGRLTRSWRSLKSKEFIRIEKFFTPVLVGFTWMLTNWTESIESWIDMRCESLLSTIKAESDWWAKWAK